MKILLATRPSALARWQTNWVIQALQAAWPDLDCEEVVITTHGDRELSRPLPEIGGKGLFTEELESAILSGKVDAAVHSLKDLPVDNPPGLVVGAVPARAEVRDALVALPGTTLENLPAGAVVGTSSLRRQAQLRARRPDLQVTSLRGNVDTRIRKLEQGQYRAILLAGAGLERLGLLEKVAQWLSLEVMLPAPGQGALAVQCRADHSALLQRLAALEDPATRATTTAERAFLTGLGGGCSLPVGAFARRIDDHLHLEGVVAAPDGSRQVRLADQGKDPQTLGLRLAQAAVEAGAAELLAGI